MMARKPVMAPAAQSDEAVPPSPLPTVDALRQKARVAFNAAYARANAPQAGEDWKRVDERWQQLGRDVVAARAMCAGANPNSAADHAGRLNEVQALISATEWFDAYQPPKAPKPSVNHNLVFAHHAAGAEGEHWLEERERLEREMQERRQQGAAA